MAEDETSEGTAKRYNTRPKTKSSLEALEDKYSNFVVNTSPKESKRQKSRENMAYVRHHMYLQSQMGHGSYQNQSYAQAPQYSGQQGYYTHVDPMQQARYVNRVPDSNQKVMFQPYVHPNVPHQMEAVYKNPPYQVPPNYQGQFRPNVMAGNYPNMQMMNQMAYNQENSPYRVGNPPYGPSTPMRGRPPGSSPSRLPNQFPVYQNSPMAHPKFGYPNFKANSPFAHPPQYSASPPSSDKRNIANVYLDPQNNGYVPEMENIQSKGRQMNEKSPKTSPNRQTQQYPQSDQIQNYFNAVNVILNDISSTSKFEKQLEHSVGRMSILDVFKFPDSHKIVTFSYLINGDTYEEIVNYLRNLKRDETQFPTVRRQHSRVSTRSNLHEKPGRKQSSEGLKEGQPEPPTNGETKDEQVDLVHQEFNNNKIHLSREKKIYPITFESCKDLSESELNSLFGFLEKNDSKLVRATDLQKFMVRSVINSSDESKNHYLLSYSEEDDDSKYVLNYQFGYFFANDFFNKRVPVFTKVDFGDTDPSFMFTKKNTPKKSSKLSLNYAKVSRSFDVLVDKLDTHVTFEASKILYQREKHLSNTTHQLSLHCRLSSLPSLLSMIHFTQ